MRSPFHPEQRARIRQIKALKDRLFVAVAANRPPLLIDLCKASAFCGLVEAGIEIVEGTALNSLYLQLNTLLPAAEVLYDRFNPPLAATAVVPGTIVIDPEGGSVFTSKERAS